jgi:hypothetical protein
VRRPKLTVLIPTQGRPSLRDALRSVREQATAKDAEIIVCADTHGPLFTDVAALAAEHDAFYLEHDAGHHGYGHPQLATAYRRATGAYVAVLGDDDEFYAGGPQTIISVTRALTEPQPVLFRITMEPSATRHMPAPFTIWREQSIYCGNVSGQSIVLPNDPSKLAEYPPHSTGDYEFIRDTVENYGGADRVVWRTEVIALCH